ncbi:MAG: class I SAM-dependent rRNA methyltransferase [Candidatus Omnitrophica bacterium]|nr:class I SAM-dependent rRNA methyltransferase [Candidatus Omnitrophota bacterium]MBU4479226.1 class I SAM-dependent rRNA methyltransferase [Candidatus Omnitrophota bacterium]
MNNFPTVKLKFKRDVPVRAGHPWIFSNAVESKVTLEPGDLVRVESSSGEFLGIGMWNPLTSIRIRLLTREAQVSIDTDFFSRQFSRLDDMKRRLLPADTNGYRLCHGDADSLPGLIIDRYADVFVFQIHTLGMEQFREMIVSALQKMFKPKAIVERSDVDARRVEGLKSMPVEVYCGRVDEPVVFKENGYSFCADVLKGQKTGFFLDQRDARLRISGLAKDRKVLNLFSYSAASSVYCALGGAKSVLSVDTSLAALELGKKNFGLNGLDVSESRFEFVQANVFELLASRELECYGFDLIICDPPPLTKSRANAASALKMYTRINTRCLSLLAEGGILATSSCSGSISSEQFRDVLRLAAGYAGRDARIIENLGQPFDHTDRIAFPEGRYLKTTILEVVKS